LEMHALFTLSNGTVPAKKGRRRRKLADFQILEKKRCDPIFYAFVYQIVFNVKNQDTDSNNHKLGGLYFPTVKCA
jgi:hypothetical protein